jgi:hypothetical protein
MSEPKQPADPSATIKMVPGAMFQTREFSQEEIAERLAQRGLERAEEAAAAQPEAIQPPPSTSSPA